MSEAWGSTDAAPSPEHTIGVAIQDLTAARLGRGFVPLAVLCVAGVVELVWRGEGGMLLAAGALVTGVAMLAYGLRISQRAFGHPPRLWMSLAMLGSLLPPIFGVYVFGWRGLRTFAVGSGLGGVVEAVFFTVMGVLSMRAWMRVVEVERLAKVMAMGSDGGAR